MDKGAIQLTKGAINAQSKLLQLYRRVNKTCQETCMSRKIACLFGALQKLTSPQSSPTQKVGNVIILRQRQKINQLQKRISRQLPCAAQNLNSGKLELSAELSVTRDC